MINEADFKQPLASLLAEAFGVSQAPTGFFLDTGQSGLLGTLATISAETASTPFTPGAETIAAHSAHVLYLLRIFEAYERGEALQIDWPGSWATHSVDAAAWAELCADLGRSYATVSGQFQAREQWPQQAVAAAIMLVAHCAYHVGVIHAMRTGLEK